ncbi:hypothetical protein K7432_016576 [Basidiobolus ranarum]|uniref:Carrier domain-containing protein n=1 Tax=Basidiobolus ranarum TaxID=34480 RepID=A0ABR2WEJ1_9FUNG
MMMIKYCQLAHAGICKYPFTKDGWFRTGDTANLANGALELVGRTKDSIILRGVNYYGNELEAALQNIEGIVPSFVAVCPIRPKGSQTEQVAVFYLPSFSLSDEEALLRTHSSIQQKLIQFCSQAPHVILPLSKNILTKNSLGKLSRGKLRQRYEKGEFDEFLKIVEQIVQTRKALKYKKPTSDTEIALASFLCKIFDVPSDDMCVEENFFSMGGSSLEVVQYKARIIEHFNLAKNWPVIRIMQHPTIRALATHLDESKSNATGGALATHLDESKVKATTCFRTSVIGWLHVFGLALQENYVFLSWVTGYAFQDNFTLSSCLTGQYYAYKLHYGTITCLQAA